MVEHQIICTAHLKQARGGAIELETFGALALAEQVFGHGRSGGEEADAVIVQRVYENDKTLGFVPFVGIEKRDVVDEDCIETIGYREKIRSAERLFAKVGEGKAGHTALARGTRMERPFIGISVGATRWPPVMCRQAISIA